MMDATRSARGLESLHRVDMDFTKPVSIIITRIFTSTTDSFVFIAPLWQWIIDEWH